MKDMKSMKEGDRRRIGRDAEGNTPHGPKAPYLRETYQRQLTG